MLEVEKPLFRVLPLQNGLVKPGCPLLSYIQTLDQSHEMGMSSGQHYEATRPSCGMSGCAERGSGDLENRRTEPAENTKQGGGEWDEVLVPRCTV